MRLIDTEGRILGKINIFDLLLLLFVGALLTGFVLSCFNFSTAQSSSGKDAKLLKSSPEKNVKLLTANIECLLMEIEPQTAKKIALGDAQRDEQGQIVAELIRLGEFADQQYVFDIGAEQSVQIIDSSLLQIPVTLRLKVELRDGQLYFQNQAVRTRTTTNFQTDSYKVKVAFVFNKEGSGLANADNAEVYGRINDLDIELRNIINGVEKSILSTHQAMVLLDKKLGLIMKKLEIQNLEAQLQ